MDNDYYSTLYSWFEKCGIISNIRTQLRQNLINTLKNKDLSLKQVNGTPKSAKQYVYDLLIAEYLFSTNYTYSLSVFASEAPLLVNFNNNVSGCTQDDRTKSKWKLQDDYVIHSLETLGIDPKCLQGQYIQKNYSENDIPLLLCILKCLSVSSFNISYQNNNIDNVKKNRNSETQTDLTEETEFFMHKLVTAKKKLIQQKKKLDIKFKEREIMLKEQALKVEEQIDSLNKRLEEAQDMLHCINSKEKYLTAEKQNETQRIFQKEMELAFRDKLLIQEAERLEKERDSYRKFEVDLQKLQQELIKVQKELPSETTNKFNVKNEQVQTNLDYEILDLKKMDVLKKEKQELMNLVQEQQLRITQLTLRTVQLSRKLEENQLSKQVLDNVPVMNTGSISIGNLHTIVSESSSTDDIIHDAKLRLKRLEVESLVAGNDYFKCLITSP